MFRCDAENQQAGFASLDLLLIYLLIVMTTVMGMGLVWLKANKYCYSWLDRSVMELPDSEPEAIFCFGQYWQEPPAEIDFGAGFQKNRDAPVLCFLEDLIPELQGELQCE